MRSVWNGILKIFHHNTYITPNNNENILKPNHLKRLILVFWSKYIVLIIHKQQETNKK